MNNVDALDLARGGPFRYRLDGEDLTGANPVDLPYQIVLVALQDEVMPGTPGDLAYWKVTALFERWQAHYDLPDFNGARRLAYAVDHYIDTLTYDLRAHLSGADLGALWRERRWNTLLALIDRLPRYSYYYEAVANDPEHAEMVAKALAEQGDRDEAPASSGPALSTWTPEVERLVELVDAVKGLYAVIPMSQGAKGVKAPPPLERPQTLLEQARKRGTYNRRLAAHKKLAARLLPHKYPNGAE